MFSKRSLHCVTVVQASWTALSNIASFLLRHFLLLGWAGREADGPFKMEEEVDPLLEAFCHSPESTKLFLALRVEPLITGAISVTWILCIPVAVPAVPAQRLHSLCFSHNPKLLSLLCYCSGILKKEKWLPRDENWPGRWVGTRRKGNRSYLSVFMKGYSPLTATLLYTES